MHELLKRAFPHLLLVVAALGSDSARANTGSFFGFGSRTASLGGAGVAAGFEGYAAYANPAGLALGGDRRLKISWGALFMQPVFVPITSVVTENDYVSDKTTPLSTNVDLNYRPTFSQAIGLTYRLFPESANFSFGLTVSLPVLYAAYMDTGPTLVPEYFLYRARTHRPQVEVGFGADLGGGFKVGVGLHMAFALNSRAEVFINTASTRISTMRFSSSLQPKLAPFAGILWTPGARPDDLALGLVVRLPASSENYMAVATGARVFGSFAAVDFNFLASGALYFDPLTVELGGALSHGNWGRTYAQLEYQVWAPFVAPLAALSQPQITCTDGAGAEDNCTGLVLSAGTAPTFSYVNLLVPRIGEEIRVTDAFRLRAGYAYKGSILASLPTGPGNYLDPPRHSLTAGAGLSFAKLLIWEVPTSLDLHAGVDFLEHQTVVKTPNLENGNPGSKVGAPGYEAGGILFGGGVSLSMAF